MGFQSSTFRSELETMENHYDLVFRSESVLVDGSFVPRDVGIRSGIVASISRKELSGARLVELAADEVLIPGLVDTHVHISEPGRVEREGFASASRPQSRVA
jgi:allantoinase